MYNLHFFASPTTSHMTHNGNSRRFINEPPHCGSRKVLTYQHKHEPGQRTAKASASNLQEETKDLLKTPHIAIHSPATKCKAHCATWPCNPTAHCYTRPCNPTATLDPAIPAKTHCSKRSCNPTAIFTALHSPATPLQNSLLSWLHTALQSHSSQPCTNSSPAPLQNSLLSLLHIALHSFLQTETEVQGFCTEYRRGIL